MLVDVDQVDQNVAQVLIDGKWRAADAEGTFHAENPANGQALPSAFPSADGPTATPRSMRRPAPRPSSGESSLQRLPPSSKRMPPTLKPPPTASSPPQPKRPPCLSRRA